MNKYSVVLDDEMTKTGSTEGLCPKCGAKLEHPNYCRFCGTEPFEKKPETQDKK